MAGRNPFPKAVGAGQESCAESTVNMKYAPGGLGGWMGKLWAGTGTGGGVCDRDLGNSLGQSVGALAQIHIGLEKLGMRSFGQEQAGLGSSVLPAELCTCCIHCTHCAHCTRCTHCTCCTLGWHLKFPKSPSSPTPVLPAGLCHPRPPASASQHLKKN